MLIRRFRFGISSLLVLVAICSCGIAAWVQWLNQHRAEAVFRVGLQRPLTRAEVESGWMPDRETVARDVERFRSLVKSDFFVFQAIILGAGRSGMAEHGTGSDVAFWKERIRVEIIEWDEKTALCPAVVSIGIKCDTSSGVGPEQAMALVGAIGAIAIEEREIVDHWNLLNLTGELRRSRTRIAAEIRRSELASPPAENKARLDELRKELVLATADLDFYDLEKQYNDSGLVVMSESAVTRPSLMWTFLKNLAFVIPALAIIWILLRVRR